MAGKRVLTARLVINMIAADNVYTNENQLLFPAGTVLTEDVITALKEHSVFAIRIKVDEADGKTPILWEGKTESSAELPKEELEKAFAPEPSYSVVEEAEEEKYYDVVRKTPEFKEFSETFLNTVDHMKDTFNRVVVQNEKIDSKEILSDVENVVAKSRNSLHILDMLQCMKGYDDVTYVHGLNVALLSNMIGKLVFPDISEEDLEVLTLSGLLADVGKMMISDDVLQKDDRLTIPEYNVIKTHVLHSNNILKGMNLDPRIAEVAMRHHERCDGSGYPGGYRQEQIIPFAKIVAIADTYDAMTSDRVYRGAICPFEVIHMFEREGLSKYDARFLIPFLEKAVQAYINTKVLLSNGMTGRVIMINRKDLARPVVKVKDEFIDLSYDTSIKIKEVLV